ncbi:MAG: NAD-dependent epimerase/dehydratase family protein [Deltaproteobacteria bacterium]|nr:NAD-dependent epimerase/dehydratase family protein [Deltaproteobacteria bacterium]
MNILVTGAAGYIGGRMVEILCQKDWVKTVVGTDIKPANQKFSKYQFIKRDILESMDDIIGQNKIDTVVHTAYVLPPIHDKKQMEDINKGGTRNVLDACVKAGIKQILYTSSTTAYGFYPNNDSPLTEGSPLRGNDDFTYAKNKKEIESILRGFISGHPDITVTIVRPCFVVGPGFKNPMAEHLKKKIVMLPSKTLPWQFVHEDDLVNVMALLLEKRMGGEFNVTAEGTLSFSEMVKTLGNTRVPLPWWLLYPLNNLSWFLRLSFITRFPSPAMRMMINPWIASSEKLVRQTGYQFMFNSRQAFESFAMSSNK